MLSKRERRREIKSTHRTGRTLVTRARAFELELLSKGRASFVGGRHCMEVRLDVFTRVRAEAAPPRGHALCFKLCFSRAFKALHIASIAGFAFIASNHAFGSLGHRLAFPAKAACGLFYFAQLILSVAPTLSAIVQCRFIAVLLAGRLSSALGVGTTGPAKDRLKALRSSA